MQATGMGIVKPQEVISSHREAVVWLEVEMIQAIVEEHWAKVLDILRRGSQHWFMLYVTERTKTSQMLLQEFDIILGMDWLVKHQANLDCVAKQMILRTEKGGKVIIIKELWNYLSNVISASRAEKLVRKGCEAYLAYVSASGSEISSMKDIKIVKDFSDVIPNEFPRLPPNRYYRWFAEGFLLIAAPLTKLLRKEVLFKWTNKQQESFERLKKVLAEAPVLIQQDFRKDFTVYSVASHVGLGCVLM
ncbi:uncharacterized protein LOC108451654 [Gossypium arboreum]|uniref:uncharacterized protein LOC108451654 n=1 Tax=Gossypium arboreum TaxID=29729 RepID=UPI00081964E2|nr:uncharacterized protein LOC108451654 [Gossypium arboreum]